MKRNITGYMVEGSSQSITEIHPLGTEPSTEAMFKKVKWTHRTGVSGVNSLIHRFISKAPKKRVYLLFSNGSSYILLGFHPKLTKRERELLISLVDG